MIEMQTTAPASRLRVRTAGRLAALLERVSGIFVPEHQLESMLGKTEAMVPAGLSLGDFLDDLERDRDLCRRFIERMCTHETRFFRHAEQFALVETDWAKARAADPSRRRVRAWSVACSSGEEPYSLAMMLLDHFPRPAGWSVEVVGTDVSTQVLKRAAEATWPLARAGEIPPDRLERYMLRGHGESTGFMRASPSLRSVVTFSHMNLVDPPYSAAGEGLDLVLLRNVLIYFSKENRRRVVEAIVPHLAPGAWLVTGPSEGVSHLGLPHLDLIAPHIFRYPG